MSKELVESLPESDLLILSRRDGSKLVLHLFGSFPYANIFFQVKNAFQEKLQDTMIQRHSTVTCFCQIMVVFVT